MKRMVILSMGAIRNGLDNALAKALCAYYYEAWGLTAIGCISYAATSSCPSRARETIVPSGLTMIVHPKLINRS